MMINILVVITVFIEVILITILTTTIIKYYSVINNYQYHSVVNHIPINQYHHLTVNYHVISSTVMTILAADGKAVLTLKLRDTTPSLTQGNEALTLY